MRVLCIGAARNALVHLSCSTHKYSGVFDFPLSHTFLFAHFAAFVTEPLFGAFPLVLSYFCCSCVCCNLPMFGDLRSWTMLFVLVHLRDQDNQNMVFLHILHFIFSTVAQIFLPCFLPRLTLPFVFTIVSSACTLSFIKCSICQYGVQVLTYVHSTLLSPGMLRYFYVKVLGQFQHVCLLRT